MLAGTFDGYRNSRKAIRRNCHGQSIGQINSIFEETFWVDVLNE